MMQRLGAASRFDEVRVEFSLCAQLIEFFSDVNSSKTSTQKGNRPI